MRLGHAIFVATIAALFTLAAPGQPAAPSSCHSYQQAADGSWSERPCQELGVSAQPQHKSATRKTDEQTR